MVNLFVANTDNRWFDFLSSEPHLTEVNFWWPGEMGFRAIQPGELLAFRLKSPRNKVGGFGIFSSHSRLPIQTAWEAFGRANGVSSLEALRSAIAQFRTNPTLSSTDIGSTILVEPVFSPPTFGSIYRRRGLPVFSEVSAIRPTIPRVSACGIA
jgi:putative restriction endonuclease